MNRLVVLALAGFASLCAHGAPIPGFTPAPAAPGTVLTNEPYTAQACFDNLSPIDTGYQPNLQVVVPAGSTLTSAQFLSFNLVRTTVGTCSVPAGCPTGIVNPVTGATVPLQFNESLVIVGGSSGSFAPAQPPACVSLGFSLGDPTVAPLGLTRNIQITPYFAFGADPLDNPAVDPPIVGAQVNLGVTPSVVRLTKTIAAPEGETATGPNYTRTVTLALDIANGQTLTNFDLTDVLPNTLQYVTGSASVTGCAGTVTNTSTPGASPGGTLTRRCATATGATGGSDVVLTFQVYVPKNDGVGTQVVTPAAPVKSIPNTGNVAGTYDPPGPVGPGPVNATSNTATLAAKLLTLRKSVADVVDVAPPGPSPGDTLEYTLTFDLSDYYSVTLQGAGRLQFTDILGDGQTFVGCADANTTISAQANGVALPVQSFPGATCSAGPKAADGTTTITFDAAAILQPTYGNTLFGDLANDAIQSGSTTVTVKFRATIDATFSQTPWPGPGSPELTLGDIVGNNASGGGASAGTTVNDPTSASVTIVPATFAKSIYAYTDAETHTTHIPPPTGFLVSPGDLLTYRLTWTLPLASYEIAKLDDYLPSPVFSATSITSVDVASARNPALAPPAGTWTAGPSDTFTKITPADPVGLVQPTLATSAVQNSVTWDYGSYGGQEVGRVVDLLFTVAATTRPFGDGLNLLNLAQAQYQNTFATVTASAAGTVFTTRAPNVTIHKDIVGSSNPTCTAAPPPTNYDSAFSGCDGGDRMDFRVALANAGRSPAYNVRIFDDGGLPAIGYAGSCSVTSITDGSGNPIAVKDGAGNPVTLPNAALFDATAAGGLVIAQIPGDSDPTVTPGEQVNVLYSCTISSAALPGLVAQKIDNTARLAYYSSDPLQATDPLYNYAANQSFPGPNVRKAEVAVGAIASIAKDIIDSSVTQTVTPNINFGETLTFRITLKLYEQVYALASLTDTQIAIPPIDCTNPAFTCTPNITVGGSTVTVTPTPATAFGIITYTYSLPKTASGSNTTTFTALNAPAKSATASWTLVNPAPAIAKNFSPATADGGDTVQIRLGWSNANAGTSPMFQCVVTDPVNTTIFDPTTLAAVTTPAGYTFAADTGTGIVTYTATDPTAPCTDVPANGAVFSVKVRDNASTGGSVSNTATLAWNTLPSPQTGGATGTLPASASLTLSAPTAVKTVTASSEPDTGPVAGQQNLAIGEIVTYQLVFTMPDGVTKAVRLTDDMTGGLANLGFVAGSARLARNTTALTAANDPGAINSTVPGTFVNVTPVCVGSGACAATEVRFDLGDVANDPATGTSSDQYTLQLQFQVLNVAANTGNTSRSNRARMVYRPTGSVSDQTINLGTVSVRVATPVVTVAKSVVPLPVTSGDTITYTLTIRNNSSGNGAATAYDWTFADTLPPELIGPSLGTITAPVGVTVNAAFTGNTLSGTISRLDPGQQVVVPYTVTVDPLTPIGRTITNAANAQTTSLPGPCGTSGNVSAPCTPLVGPATIPLGDPGTASGERTGAGSGANNLTAGVQTPFTTGAINLTKVLVSPQTFYAIGDVVQYQVSITIPKGTALAVSLKDTLPAGLAYVAGSATIAATGGPISTTLPGLPPTVAGQNLSFDFGDITAANAGTFDVRYSAVVQNVLTNQNNTPLVNNARIVLTDPNTGNPVTRVPPSLPTATVGEPNLVLAKVIVSGDPGADAGNTVRWSINAQNTGTTTAQRVDLKDVLPAGLDQISNIVVTNPGNQVTLNGTATPVTATHVHVGTTTNPGDSLDVASAVPDGTDFISIPAGAQLTIAFDSIVMQTVIAGQTLVNALSVPYASQPTCADNALCRDGSGAPLNDYVANASKSLTINSAISIDKQVSPPTAPIGATVTFTAKVGVIEGITPHVIFSDVLPAGLTPISWTVAVGNLGMTLGNPTYATNLGSGQTVTFDFGDVTNPSSGSAADDFVEVDIVARVDNVAGNQNNVQLKNGEQTAGSLVTVKWGAPATTVTFDADPGTPGIQGRPVTVTEPELGVTKTVVPTAQALGDVVTYSVTVSHLGSSTADAFDVALTDTLPVGLTFIPGSVNPPAADGGIAGQVLTLNVGTLLQANSATITYRARVNTSAVVGAPISNSVLATWASQSGATGAPTSGRTGSGGVNDYRATASAPVTPTTAAFIDAQKRVAIAIDADASGNLTPGDTLQYTVTLTNTGAAVTNVVYTDPIPVNTTYAATPAPSTTAGSITATSPLFTVNVGPMAAGAVVTIKFSVTVNAGTAAGTVISNQGLVDSDQTVPKPTDANGIAADGDQPTVIVVGGNPTPANALYAQKLVTLQSDNDGSGTITQGDRMRYTIVLQNTGSSTLTSVSFADVIPSGLTYVPASATASAGTLSVTGAAVSWTAIGSLAPAAQVTATFDVTIASVTGSSQTYVNQGTATSTQTGNVKSDGNGDPTDGNQPTSFTAVGGGGTAQPALDVQKRFAIAIDTPPLGVASPGDTLAYSITVANNGSAASVNTRLTDPVPTCTGTLSPCTAYVAGSLVTSQGAIVSTAPIDVNLGTLAPGATATVSFRVVVDPATANGVVIANQAQVTYTGGGPVPSDDNGNPADGLNPTLTPIATGSGTAGVPGDLSKQLAGTSEPNGISAGNAVVIGEVARFDLSASMPPGTTRQVRFLDTLPAGLAYLPGSARLSRTFNQGLNASANPGGINAAPSGASVPLADGTDIVIGASAGGTTLSVFLGDVINSDNDANLELYTLEYRVVVQNVAGNQAATALTNAATVSFWNALSQTQTLTPVAVTLTVATPNVSITKSVSPTSILSTGGTPTYTITIANAAGANVAPAFDVALLDPLPPAFTSVGARTITASGASGVLDTTTGTTVGVAIARLDPGGTVTIVYPATAPGPLANGLLPNTATATWTSLPGTNGSAADGVATPGAPGSATGERTGSGGVNDLAGNASAVVRVGSASIAKAIVAPQPRYAIGDVVSYQVDLAVPIGTFGAAQVTDVLPPGLTYVPGSLAIVVSGVSASVTPADFAAAADTPGVGQTTLTAAFGTLTNAGPTAGTVRLTYRAFVANVLSNQANTSLANSAVFSFSDPGSGGATVTRGPATATLVVGEPFLALTKALLSSPVGLAAGSTASYSVTAGNTGTTTAFETVVSDALPAGMTFPGGTIVTVTPSNLSGLLQVPTVVVTASGWQTSAFDLPVGDSVTFTFTATLANSVQPGQTLQNGVTGTYSSRDGSDPNERNGTSPGSNQSDDSLLNNYNTSALAPTITVADPIAIDKSFSPNPALNRYTLGQLVTFRLKVSLLEGTTKSVNVIDVLPAGLTFVSSGAPGTAPGAPITFSYGGAPTVAGQTVTFSLGDVINAPDGNAGNDFITIDVTARVDNVVTSQDGTVLGNHASVSFVNALGATVVRDFDANAIVPGVQPLDLIVIEPVLALTKSAAPASVSLGDQVTFTLLVDHLPASHADAFDVVVTDTLPPGLTYVAGSASLAPTVSGATLSFNVGALTLATDSLTITFRAQVAAAAAVGVPLTNNATLTYASIPGATGAPDSGRNGNGGPLNDYVAASSAAVTPNANAQITALKTVAMVVDADATGNLTPGDTVEWTIVLTNTGPPVTGTIFTDPIPANTSYVAGSASTSAGSIGATSSVVTANIGAMAAGASVTIKFRVTVDPGVVPGTVLSNQGVVDSDQTVPTLTDNNGDPSDGLNPTTIVVNGVPALSIVKAQSFPADANADGQLNAGEQIRYTLTVTSIGTATALNVVLTDPVPVNTALLTATTTTGTVVGLSPVTVNIGTLAVGATATVTITVQVDAGTAVGTIVTNQGTVNATGMAGVPSNTVSATIVAPPVQSALTKSILPGTIPYGGTAKLTLTLGNPNAITLTLGAAFTDALPAGMTTASANTGTCAGVTVAPTIVTMAAGSGIPPGGCTIAVLVTSSTLGTVVNTTGSLQTNAGLTGPASAPLTVTPVADLAITKTNGVTTVTPGDSLTYTIVATNLGPNAVVGATVVDTVPSSLFGVTWTCTASPGSGCPASGSGSIGAPVNLLVGGSATFTLKAGLSKSAVGTLTNTATVATPAGVSDPNPGNNSATDADPIAVLAPELIPAASVEALAVLALALALFGATGLRRRGSRTVPRR